MLNGKSQLFHIIIRFPGLCFELSKGITPDPTIVRTETQEQKDYFSPNKKKCSTIYIFLPNFSLKNSELQASSLEALLCKLFLFFFFVLLGTILLQLRGDIDSFRVCGGLQCCGTKFSGIEWRLIFPSLWSAQEDFWKLSLLNL